jgi:hypothetical protein
MASVQEKTREMNSYFLCTQKVQLFGKIKFNVYVSLCG